MGEAERKVLKDSIPEENEKTMTIKYIICEGSKLFHKIELHVCCNCKLKTIHNIELHFDKLPCT